MSMWATFKRDFPIALKRCFLQKFAKFDGRASRREYGYFFLFWCLIVPILVAINMAVILISSHYSNEVMDFLYANAFNLQEIFYFPAIICAIPGLAVMVRRMHDINLSAKFLLLLVIPFINGLFLWLLLLKKGSKSENKYGEIPDW